MGKYTIPDEELAKIARRTDKQISQGKDILKSSVEEALDYIGGIIDGDIDKAIALQRNGVMLGIVEVLTEKVIPDIYLEMRKDLHKRPMKMPKELAYAISNIFLARALNNMVARLEDERD